MSNWIDVHDPFLYFAVAIVFLVASCVGVFVGSGFVSRIGFAALTFVVEVLVVVSRLVFPNSVFSGLFALATLFVMCKFAVSIRRLPERDRLIRMGILLAVIIMNYAMIYMLDGVCSDNCDRPSLSHDFVSALYFSIITFTTTGYGDLHPQDGDRLVAASEALAGYIFFGLFVSLLASYFAKPEKLEDKAEGTITAKED